jgi:GNAT superfamily N-acetyltransferase
VVVSYTGMYLLYPRASEQMKHSYGTESPPGPVGACIIHMMYAGENKWIITSVQTYPKYRGKGFAHRLIHEVITDADKDGVTLMLSAEAEPNDSLKKPGMSQEALIAWYKRLGFKQMDPSDPRAMIRK